MTQVKIKPIKEENVIEVLEKLHQASLSDKHNVAVDNNHDKFGRIKLVDITTIYIVKRYDKATERILNSIENNIKDDCIFNSYVIGGKKYDRVRLTHIENGNINIKFNNCAYYYSIIDNESKEDYVKRVLKDYFKFVYIKLPGVFNAVMNIVEKKNEADVKSYHEQYTSVVMDMCKKELEGKLLEVSELELKIKECEDILSNTQVTEGIKFEPIVEEQFEIVIDSSSSFTSKHLEQYVKLEELGIVKTTNGVKITINDTGVTTVITGSSLANISKGLCNVVVTDK